MIVETSLVVFPRPGGISKEDTLSESLSIIFIGISILSQLVLFVCKHKISL